MTLADIFEQELAKDAAASEAVKKLGAMLAKKYREQIEVCADLAKMHCDLYYKRNSQ